MCHFRLWRWETPVKINTDFIITFLEIVFSSYIHCRSSEKKNTNSNDILDISSQLKPQIQIQTIYPRLVPKRTLSFFIIICLKNYTGYSITQKTQTSS